ncbi:ATP-binding protein, partial [Hyalangium minutum]|uniref:ATP-binding protein n=1 Tax=Hyalangium minutum TaxID=394096 RepID=UPI00196A02D1
ACTSRGCAACPPTGRTARAAPVSGPPRHLRSSPHPQHGLYPAYTPFALQGSRLTVWVRDEGSGFDPSQIPHPLELGNRLKASGRGLFLLRSLLMITRLITVFEV